MNTLVKELMLQAGYACPEMGKRAQLLVQFVVEKCTEININSAYTDDGNCRIRKAFYEPTKTKES